MTLCKYGSVPRNRSTLWHLRLSEVTAIHPVRTMMKILLLSGVNKTRLAGISVIYWISDWCRTSGEVEWGQPAIHPDTQQTQSSADNTRRWTLYVGKGGRMGRLNLMKYFTEIFTRLPGHTQQHKTQNTVYDLLVAAIRQLSSTLLGNFCAPTIVPMMMWANRNKLPWLFVAAFGWKHTRTTWGQRTRFTELFQTTTLANYPFELICSSHSLFVKFYGEIKQSTI